MRFLSHLTLLSYIGGFKHNSFLEIGGKRGSCDLGDLHIQTKDSLSERNADSFEDFINEADYEGLLPEHQLEKLEEDKKVYDNLQRLVRRSKAFELPANEVVSEVVYPPPSDDTLEKAEIREPYDRHYDPIRISSKSNTTLELLPSIVQKPLNRANPKVYSNFDLSNEKCFSIRDYTELAEREPLHENEFYLREVNERLFRNGQKPIPSFEEHLNSSYTLPGETKSKFQFYEDLNSNETFVRLLRELKLEKAKKYRKFLAELRRDRTSQFSSFYANLARDSRGFAILDPGDVEKLSLEELQQELRTRGYRCSFDLETLKEMLGEVVSGNNAEEDAWRFEHIATQELREDNLSLPEHARHKLREVNEMVNILKDSENADDMNLKIKRLEIITELVEFYTDPVTYLDLDRSFNARVSAEELEQIKRAPTVYDTTFLREMSKPIVKLPDLIPRTFNLQEDYVMKYPITTINKSSELDDLKREYLSIPGGIHQQTLPEISERFEVPLDFLGDACCRLGANAPIDLERQLRHIVSYSAIWDLVQFLNVCDPAEIELFYSNFTLTDVSERLNVPLSAIYRILGNLNVKSHFGPDSRLNLSCLKALELELQNLNNQ